MYEVTGYTVAELENLLESSVSCDEFFQKAPCLNEKRHLITGSVCGVKLAEIEDLLMLKIRYLDKLVDELTKDKPMEKVLRTQRMMICIYNELILKAGMSHE